MTRSPNNKHTQPSKALRAKAAAVFSPDKLKAICELDTFSHYAPRIDLSGFERFYHYQDNGASVLAVAHLDTVQADRTCNVTETAAGYLATSGGLDDRLGVYTILEWLPALGINTDILLTTDEEICQTTAADFAGDCTKEYNWIIEFDRGGTDVVMYQYETDEYVELVGRCGARVGTGSYSDIAALESLGVACFNWGIGYADYHSERSHAWIDDTIRMVARFVKFYGQNAETFLPHDPTQYIERADCGHFVDLARPSTYMSTADAILCVRCWYQDLWGQEDR